MSDETSQKRVFQEAVEAVVDVIVAERRLTSAQVLANCRDPRSLPVKDCRPIDPVLELNAKEANERIVGLLRLLQADVERLDWLEENATAVAIGGMLGVVNGGRVLVQARGSVARGDDLRRTIDMPRLAKARSSETIATTPPTGVTNPTPSPPDVLL